MRTDRLRHELSRLDSVETPDLLPEIVERTKLAQTTPPPLDEQHPVTRLGRSLLVIGVAIGVVVGLIVLARVFPEGKAAREGEQGRLIPGNAIVLAVVHDGTTHLYLVQADGSGYRELTNDDSPIEIHGRSVAVSPDGTQAAFARFGSDNRGIWISDIDGSHPVRLTEATSNGDQTPSWSLDGGSIVFTRNSVGHGELFTIGDSGSDLTQVTANTVGQDLRPAWAPSGQRVVFTRNSRGSVDLWIVAAEGTGERRLTDFHDQLEGAPSYADWSPDGSRIVFAATPPNERGSRESQPLPRDLWAINPDGTHLERLTHTPQDEVAPRWSPDGESIVFLSDGAHMQVTSRIPAYGVSVLDLSSGSVRTLEAPTGNLIDLSIQWLS